MSIEHVMTYLVRSGQLGLPVPQHYEGQHGGAVEDPHREAAAVENENIIHMPDSFRHYNNQPARPL